VTVRRAVPGDADALAALRYEFRAAIGEPEETREQFILRCAAWMRDHLRDDAGDWRGWVAEDADGIAGTVWAHHVGKMPNPVDEPEVNAYVTNFYVREAYRSRGIGGALLDAMMADCRASGVDSAFLWPSSRSRPLYLRHGFRGDVMLEWRASKGMPH
jgi:GNAT superfamily N-acetyltransferase